MTRPCAPRVVCTAGGFLASCPCGSLDRWHHKRSAAETTVNEHRNQQEAP